MLAVFGRYGPAGGSMSLEVEADFERERKSALSLLPAVVKMSALGLERWLSG